MIVQLALESFVKKWCNGKKSITVMKSLHLSLSLPLSHKMSPLQTYVHNFETHNFEGGVEESYEL